MRWGLWNDGCRSALIRAYCRGRLRLMKIRWALYELFITVCDTLQYIPTVMTTACCEITTLIVIVDDDAKETQEV